MFENGEEKKQETCKTNYYKSKKFQFKPGTQIGVYFIIAT